MAIVVPVASDAKESVGGLSDVVCGARIGCARRGEAGRGGGVGVAPAQGLGTHACARGPRQRSHYFQGRHQL